jgi:hypothetical protein
MERLDQLNRHHAVAGQWRPLQTSLCGVGGSEQQPGGGDCLTALADRSQP